MLSVEYVNIADIKPYKRNAKLHTPKQVEQIKESILEFGFCDPIAVSEDNTIIESHGRFEALKQLGYKKVEVIRLAHLSEEQVKAYNLTHNKLTMNTGFDKGLVDLELGDICSIDMSKFGFSLDIGKEEPNEFHRKNIVTIKN